MTNELRGGREKSERGYEKGRGTRIQSGDICNFSIITMNSWSFAQNNFK